MSGALAGGTQLKGAGALVTGASRGIGAAIARTLVAAGATVALLARSGEPLARLAAELGHDSFAVPCDVRSTSAVTAAAAGIAARLGGPPTILVNNAGLFALGPAHEMPIEAFEALIDTNLVAPFRFIRAFLPEMLARGTGHVVTIGSVADRTAWPGNSAYASGKYGARALHEVLRAETRGSGVRATLVSPAATDTPLWSGVEGGAGTDVPARSDMLRPDDAARAVLFALTQPPSVNVDELRISRA